MALTDMVLMPGADYQALCDALRKKLGSDGVITSGELEGLIERISTGAELPALTNPGTAADLRQGKQLIDADGKTVEGALAEVEVAAPTISVAANGRITATVEQAAGITEGGGRAASLAQNTIGAQTITPGIEDQSIPAYNYLTGKQTIKGDANLTPDYLYEDQALFGVQGAKPLPEAAFPQPDGLALDPDVVYATTRPADWLTMPPPEDDEIYLLNQYPDGLDGAFTAQIKYNGSCTVEYGNLVNGVFVAKESFTPTSGTRFYKTINGDDYGDITADGQRQYLVRIKGDMTVCLLYPETDTVYGYGVPGVVDAIVGANADIRFGFNTTPRQNCEKLRYARFTGNGNTTGYFAFRQCPSLCAVSLEAELAAPSCNYEFHNCKSLIAISDTFLKTGISYSSAFYGASSLPALPKKKFAPTSVGTMFRSAEAMTIIDGKYLDTSGATDFTAFAYYAAAREITDLDISAATTFASTTFGGASLTKLTFAGETTPGGYTINLASVRMSHKALVEMINSLPTATAAATITITGNPGASELTEEEIAVATARNWTITI